MFMSNISNLVSTFRLNPLKAKITNTVFKLHYRVTVLMLLAAFVLVCSREYFGQNISCIANKGVPEDITNTYCYFTGTFTIVKHYNDRLLKSGLLPHPGVGPKLPTDDALIHHYYQWVPLVLIFQAVCFYLPYSTWKKREGGRIKSVVDGLQLGDIALEEQDISMGGLVIPSRHTLQRRIQLINADLFIRMTLSRSWAAWLIWTEVLNLLNLMLQIFITDVFLNGKFISLGPLIISSQWDVADDPLEHVFPKVTKCQFFTYGPSGTVQNHDVLCVMALNIIHEKVYSVLWFWYLALLILSIGMLLYRLMTFCFYRRAAFMNMNSYLFWGTKTAHSIKSNPDSSIYRATDTVIHYLSFTDWLFLHYLSKNMNKFFFQELFRIIAHDIRNNRYNDPEINLYAAIPSAPTMRDEDYKDKIEWRPHSITTSKDSDRNSSADPFQFNFDQKQPKSKYVVRQPNVKLVVPRKKKIN